MSHTRSSLDVLWTNPGLGWMDDAACVDEPPELFFPPTEQGKTVCDGCPVKRECLSFALVNNIEFGLWGGLNQKQRRAIRKQSHPRYGANRKDSNAEAVSASS